MPNTHSGTPYLGLKILVIVMGVMIILGVIGLGVALVKRFGNVPATNPSQAAIANSIIPLPKNMRVTAISPYGGAASGSDKNTVGSSIALLLQDTEGHQAILLYNPSIPQTTLLRLQPQME
ncbi:MAG: hypothetical protein ORN98_05595 [Alphaproteobacteria bacterium]|nr:hypothetical protein [Alphaproteobacteria bacterium]